MIPLGKGHYRMGKSNGTSLHAGEQTDRRFASRTNQEPTRTRAQERTAGLCESLTHACISARAFVACYLSPRLVVQVGSLGY